MSIMSSFAPDVVSFDFSLPSSEPATPPSFSFDHSLLELPFNAGHGRSSSVGSTYSIQSTPSESAATASTRRTTPARSPVRTHGPLLLPKIRSQDQTIGGCPPVTVTPLSKRAKTSPAANSRKGGSLRPTHVRSYTNPEPILFSAGLYGENEPTQQPSLLCSPVSFVKDSSPQPPRRASSCGLDDVVLEKYGFPTYRQRPTYMTTGSEASVMTIPQQQRQQRQHIVDTVVPSTLFSQPSLSPSPTLLPSSAPMSTSMSMSMSIPSCSTTAVTPSSTAAGQLADPFLYQPYAPRAPSPLAMALAPSEPTFPMAGTSTSLLQYLGAQNPAPSLVHAISFPLRDPHIKHFWWDVRQVRPWANFNASTILSLPGAEAMLTCPVPECLLPAPQAVQRHPETESALHSIYANYYLPKLNAALALSSTRPLQLSLPAKTASATASAAIGMNTDCMFVANVANEPASAATIFGGKPTARLVGLVKSFDRFNTGMRVEGNIKRVEYLRGLSHLHHAMREHGCRYGFILTEIELVLVRNGSEATPHFGYLEVTSVQLAASAGDSSKHDDGNGEGSEPTYASTPLTACLALWGLCMMASDEMAAAGQAPWRAAIGAPAEGTRRKALPRDDWMPQPQLAEKREAKRARGWVLPEDPVGRKELGKRGVKYGGC